MRITVVSPPLNLSGGARIIVRYADGLARRGHHVRLVTPRPRASLITRLQARLRGERPGEHAKHPAFRPLNELTEVLVLDEARAVEERDVPDADVVVATWWETSHWVARLSPRKGAKAYFMQDYGAPGQELADLIPTWSLNLHIITISQWLAGLIREHVGDVPLSLVPNAVDLSLFRGPQRTKPLRPTVGFVYRSGVMKGWDIVLGAIEIARREIPELRLVAFGHEDRKAIRAPDGGMEYIFQPTDGELAAIYRQCTAWLFASRREGFGLPIQEAMASRTPVIATPAGAAPELIAHGGGWLVKPEDPRDMARAIVEACHLSDGRWVELSNSAYEGVASYSVEESVELFERALERAIERSRLQARKSP